MVFLLQLAWLAPLAGALLSGMRSGARWLIALAAYVLVLPCWPPTDWAGTPKHAGRGLGQPASMLITF